MPQQCRLDHAQVDERMKSRPVIPFRNMIERWLTCGRFEQSLIAGLDGRVRWLCASACTRGYSPGGRW